jgi:hypothetical protein
VDEEAQQVDGAGVSPLDISMTTSSGLRARRVARRTMSSDSEETGTVEVTTPPQRRWPSPSDQALAAGVDGQLGEESSDQLTRRPERARPDPLGGDLRHERSERPRTNGR